ncbi:MAG: putative toxin-antitoxin system toxin component, PIN family [Candidatus Adiutrix sp.]
MLDTNVLVSAFVFRSKKIYAVVDYIVSHHELVLASYIVDELKNVIGRKFPQKNNDLDEFLTALSFTLVFSPRLIPLGLFKIRDNYDAPILYTAIIEGIDVFITGDKDFQNIEVEKPTIMTIAEFEREYMAP